MRSLAQVEPVAGSLPAAFEDDAAAAAGFASAEKAEATRRAYRTDFAIFRAWCDRRGVMHLPADPVTVAAFLASEARDGIKPSTISRRAAAIRYAHRLAGAAVPTDDERVKATIRGIRRTMGAARAKKAPATGERIIAMVQAIEGDGMKALRDRALLLLGFAMAARRSELVALDVVDVVECDEGMRVTIGRSKTDQEGQGATLAIVRGARACPVRALRAWLDAAGITEGPIFRPIGKGGRLSSERLTDRSAAQIVKDAAELAGLDPALFSGHSLRAGFLTSAAKRGASIFKMMDQSRHKSVETLRGYVRDAELFKDHAGAGLL